MGKIFSLVMKQSKDIVDESIEHLDLEEMAKKYSVELPKNFLDGLSKKSLVEERVFSSSTNERAFVC
ncbi:hypothetical protein NEF87_004954 [Candidatus Lokiarchaeum ossiferum]|uniref:Uncharacterized protein n=1 Tax=Candidatus Lokiarchaeum ossiferum TaxID=2951803 RepID=A0ABY6HYQ3_9ARCH|nr:hypothetical protein NEF87_004954 [Candidatus Lokiarchaeum sp. B-35]